jgi:uncharacterized membrane protein YphA (DoxX/SURF4 family)
MREYVKAILAFASLVITNLLTNYASNGTPLPLTDDGQLSWGTLLINLATTAAGTFSVYQWPNKPTGKHAKPE